MRVLVTRPKTSAAGTMSRLAALGHDVHHLALFEAEYDRLAIQEALDRKATALIFTSAEALRALKTSVPFPQDFASLHVFAVGKKTAEAAKAVGFSSISHSSGDGTVLAELIAQSDFAKGSAPLLYLAGEPRSPELEVGLSKSAINVNVITLYRMRPYEISASLLKSLFETSFDAVLLYSAETAKRFFEIAPADKMAKTTFLCMSTKVANAVPRQFAQRLHIAEEPSEKGLFELLSKVQSSISTSGVPSKGKPD